ncbi:MAG: hypothetical protein AAFV62_10505, partial [Pseudomonadota bacterium]
GVLEGCDTACHGAVAGGIAALENARPPAYVQALEIGPRGRSASDTAGPEEILVLEARTALWFRWQSGPDSETSRDEG